ncbi:phospholipase C, phosphocholine-specific, partial [Burkholderia thailandensis]|nr:phospholipase C, phosphocholine-specific [Burkholderia thailandensis]
SGSVVAEKCAWTRAGAIVVIAVCGFGGPAIAPLTRDGCRELTYAFDRRTPDTTSPPLPGTRDYRSLADPRCTAKPAPRVPAAPSRLDPREPGVHPPRALPYDPHVHAAGHGGPLVRIVLANGGAPAADCDVFASTRRARPFRALLAAHLQPQDRLRPAPTDAQRACPASR